MNQPTTFEDRLLAVLEAEVAEAAAKSPGDRRRHRSRSVRIGALAGVGALAVAGAVAAPAFFEDQGGSAGSRLPATKNAAWAVATRADGSVEVKLRELKDPEGLERRLAKAGVRAYVTFVPPGKFCGYRNADHLAVDKRAIVDTDPAASTREFVIRIHRDRLAPDERLALKGMLRPVVKGPSGRPDNSVATEIRAFSAAVIPLDEERCDIVSRDARDPGAGITPAPGR
ncbi:hypothetical protein ACTMSW_22430 [Micromonospora sp. BQ11]|uniref:hypothetical protein n=1 Tax=Micromonospora sp. BQ11 TaxID=3452212 RepID=UPI003F89C56E